MNRALRILFIPREAFPTDRVRINVLVGRELLSRGHKIDLVMQAANDRVPLGLHAWHGRSVWVGGTDTRDGFMHRAHKHWLGFCHDMRALRLARRERYDALLVSDKFVLGALAACVARSRGLKFMFWLTFPYPEADLLEARARTARFPQFARVRGLISGWLLYKWILPRCDHVFVQSERMKQDVAARGVSLEKLSPIVTGVDTTAIAPRVAHRGTESRVTMAYLGTLTAARRLEMLIDALALLRADGMDVRLLLVGDADRARDRAMLQQHAVLRGVADHVEITGQLPQAEALAHIEKADVCVSPFHPTPILLSTSPTKLVEYLALARPVVANDHPEQRLILRESRAGVCVPWGARHFAHGVRWLMSRSSDERSAMGARGRAWIEANRSYARIADTVESTCLAVISGRNGRG